MVTVEEQAQQARQQLQAQQAQLLLQQQQSEQQLRQQANPRMAQMQRQALSESNVSLEQYRRQMEASIAQAAPEIAQQKYKESAIQDIKIQLDEKIKAEKDNLSRISELLNKGYNAEASYNSSMGRLQALEQSEKELKSNPDSAIKKFYSGYTFAESQYLGDVASARLQTATAKTELDKTGTWTKSIDMFGNITTKSPSGAITYESPARIGYDINPSYQPTASITIVYEKPIIQAAAEKVGKAIPENIQRGAALWFALPWQMKYSRDIIQKGDELFGSYVSKVISKGAEAEQKSILLSHKGNPRIMQDIENLGWNIYDRLSSIKIEPLSTQLYAQNPSIEPILKKYISRQDVTDVSKFMLFSPLFKTGAAATEEEQIIKKKKKQISIFEQPTPTEEHPKITLEDVENLIRYSSDSTRREQIRKLIETYNQGKITNELFEEVRRRYTRVLGDEKTAILFRDVMQQEGLALIETLKPSKIPEILPGARVVSEKPPLTFGEIMAKTAAEQAKRDMEYAGYLGALPKMVGGLGLKPSEGLFTGQGKYEISKGGQIPLLKTLQGEVLGLAPASSLLNLETPALSEQQMQQQLQQQLQKQQELQQQLQKQMQKTEFRFKEELGQTEITKSPTPPPPWFISETELIPSKRKRIIDLRKRKAYQLLIKRRGQFLAAGTYLKETAIRKGEQWALGTLGRTFRIKETANRYFEGEERDYLPSPVSFREYKIRKGMRIPLQNEWIQRKGIQTRAEVFEIQRARKQSFKMRGGAKWL